MPSSGKLKDVLVHWCTILDNIKSINLRLNSPTLIESFENSFLKNGPNPLFSFYSHDKYRTNTINEKNIDGVLGTQTLGGGMVGTDESTELWRHPWKLIFTVASSRSSRQKVKFEFAENSTHKKLLSLSLSLPRFSLEYSRVNLHQSQKDPIFLPTCNNILLSTVSCDFLLPNWKHLFFCLCACLVA